MPWKIPKDDLFALFKIDKLPVELVSELVSVLAVTPMPHDIEEMTEIVAEKVSSIPYDELMIIMRLIDTLYHIREATNVELPMFIDDIIEGIHYSDYSDYEDIDLQGIEDVALKRKLELLLEIRNLKILSKATMIQRDGERLYCDSKILSDIRPIFEDDPSIMPSEAVITHTLKITYHLGRDRQEFHVILNSYDLATLHEVIARAQTKEKTLQELMKKAKIENIGR